MYQFFMGNRCNLYTKKMNEPTIIEVDASASKEINRWLDQYKIDFDMLMNAIFSILKIEIEKIVFEDTQLFQLYLASGETAMLFILLAEDPKCQLKFYQDEYVFYLKNGYLMESCIQVRDGIKFGVNAIEQKIEMGKGRTYLSIQLDQFNEKLYFCIKKQIHQLKNWENIAELICWLKSFPINISSYELSIISIAEGYIGAGKVFVIHNRIFRYLHINHFGNFQVDYDGAWEAKYQGYLFKYDIFEHLCKIYIRKGNDLMLHECIDSFYYAIDLIKIMFGTVQVINNSLDNMELKDDKG